MSYQKSPLELKLWEKTNSGDLRDRAEAFGRLAELNHAREDFATSLSCAKQSTMLYEELNDSFGQAEGHYFEGRALRGQKDNSGALVKFEKSAEFFRANSNETFLGALLCEQGHAYLELKQYVLSKNAFENAMNLFVAEEKWGDAGFAALMSSEVLYILEDYSQAEFGAIRALDFLAKDEGEGSFLFIARSHKVLGDSHSAQGAFEAACDDYWKSYHLLEYLEVDQYKIEVLQDLSRSLISSGDYEAARPLVAQARELARSTGIVRDQASCDLLEAMIQMEDGEFDEAKALLTKARAVFSSSSNYRNVFRCDYELGKLLASQDHLFAATQFEYALEQAAQNKYELEDHSIYVAMAMSYLEIGRADAVVARAHRIDIRKLPDPDKVAAATNLQARALVLMGQADQALNELSYLLDETNDSLDGAHRNYALESKARALLSLGDPVQALEILGELLMQFSLLRSGESAYRVAALMQDCNLKIGQDAALRVEANSQDGDSDSVSGAQLE